MYNVVFRNIKEGTHKGIITWRSFKTKSHFNAWYNDRLQGWYEVVEEEVTEERAIVLWICQSPEALSAAEGVLLAQAAKEISELAE